MALMSWMANWKADVFKCDSFNLTAKTCLAVLTKSVKRNVSFRHFSFFISLVFLLISRGRERKAGVLNVTYLHMSYNHCGLLVFWIEAFSVVLLLVRILNILMPTKKTTINWDWEYCRTGMESKRIRKLMHLLLLVFPLLVSYMGRVIIS